MSGYTKLFNTILASTIWREKDHTRLVWITLLAMADRYGVVEASVPGLADFARVPLKACQTALEALSSPDEWSRSKEHDGRRIEAVEGGWRLLNHAKYREKLGADERREYLKLKQREYRRRKQVSTNQVTVSDTATVLTQASPTPTPSPSPEVHIQRGSTTVSNPRRTINALTVGFADFWQAYPRKIGKGSAWNAWRKLQPDTDLVAKILRSIQAHREDPQWQKEGGQFIPHPSTFLNQRRFEDELTAPQPRVAESTSRLAQAVRDFSRS